MKTLKIILLFVLMLALNVLNLVSFSGIDFKNIIFICISVILWIISIPHFRDCSKIKKVISIVFIVLFLIIAYLSKDGYRYWYPLQPWWHTAWLYMPIILLITSKIINSKMIIERTENSNKMLIVTYAVTFIIMIGIISIIEKVTENIEMDYIVHPYLGMFSSILFIYEMHRVLNIKLNICAINIIVTVIGIIAILSVNMIEFQKINKYTNSAIEINTMFNSGELNNKNIYDKLNNNIISYHEPDNDFDTYYKNRSCSFLSLGREWDYSAIVSFYKSNINNNRKNNYNALINILQQNQYVLEEYIKRNKTFEGFIMANMISTIIEIGFFIYLGNKKRENL